MANVLEPIDCNLRPGAAGNIVGPTVARQTKLFWEVDYKLWGEILASRVVRSNTAGGAKLAADALVTKRLRRLANEIEVKSHEEAESPAPAPRKFRLRTKVSTRM